MINGGLYGGILVNGVGNRNLLGISILGRYAPKETEWSLRSIAVGALIVVSVTYKNDLDLPVAGYGVGNFLDAHLKEPLTKVLDDYAIIFTAIAAETGFFGDSITTYLVVWYFYGAGASSFVTAFNFDFFGVPSGSLKLK